MDDLIHELNILINFKMKTHLTPTLIHVVERRFLSQNENEIRWEICQVKCKNY